MERSSLDEYLFTGWRHGLFGGRSDDAIGPCKPFDCRQIDEGLLSRWFGVEQLLWFEGVGIDLRLNVFTETEIGDAADRIGRAICERTRELARTRRASGREILGRIFVEPAGLKYERKHHYGVIIAAGIDGTCSDAPRLVADYAYNVLALPAMTVVWNRPISGREWKSFSPNRR